VIVSYELNFEGKTLARWSEKDRKTPPRKQVMIPREILDSPELKRFFRRSVVTSSTERKRSMFIQLEAIRMRG